MAKNVERLQAREAKELIRREKQLGAIVIMWLFVGETRGLDLKTVTGTEWDKPKKIKEETQDGE